MTRTKRRVILALSYLGAAALLLGALAGFWYRRATEAERSLRYSYQHAFGELSTAVDALDTALQKSLYAASPALSGSLCGEIYAKAMAAQMSLSALPISCETLEQTEGFLGRVGDYACALSRSGQALSEEERANLRALSETAGVLNLNLRELQNRLQAGELSLRTLDRAEQTLPETEQNAPAWAGEPLRQMEEEFPETPSLIYDGPFSEHLSEARPRALEGLEEGDEDAGRKIAAAFLGVSRSRVSPAGALEGDLPCWSYSTDEAGGASAWITVTRQGGQVLSLLSSRPVGSARTDPETAAAAAADFLRRNGYAEMEETYRIADEGVLTVNFAWRQGEVLCYSDLVKVSVALDSGQVCGFEAKGYLSAHCWRELPPVTVDETGAAAAIPGDLERLAHQLVLIPSEGKREILCHEFKCADDQGRHVLIYVNAESGAQEKILLLLEDENGTLTI